MFVQLGSYEVPVKIERKNNKNVYFRVLEDGTLYVTCNNFVLKRDIIKMIQSNEKSLLKMYEKAMNRYEKNLLFYYLGEPLTKVFDPTVKKVSIQDGMLYAKDEKMLLKWYKNECVRVFNERIDICLEGFRDIPDFALKIRGMKTRWGVNNVTKRIITLNSELLKKDIELIDYVIIHEMTHFFEGNHGKAFWELVSMAIPYYKERRKKLKY